MAGFLSPNFTQTPNDLFDDLMRDMGEAEIKVVLAIIRYTFGYHRESVPLSLKKLAEITGLSEGGVMLGAKASEERGLISKQVNGKKTTIWFANVSTSPSEVEKVVLPHPVRYSTSLGEDQLGLNKIKESNLNIVKNPGALKAMVEGAIKHEGINGQIIDILHIYPSQTKTWNACIQFLKERPATQTLDVFAAWWFKNHWKGKRGQAPGPNDIMENWPQAFIAPATLEDQGFSYA